MTTTPREDRTMGATETTGPALVCPGCGSPHVEFERGLLFCGTCAVTVEVEGGRDDA